LNTEDAEEKSKALNTEDTEGTEEKSKAKT